MTIGPVPPPLFAARYLKRPITNFGGNLSSDLRSVGTHGKNHLLFCLNMLLEAVGPCGEVNAKVDYCPLRGAILGQ